MGRRRGPLYGVPPNKRYKYISFKPEELGALNTLLDATESGIVDVTNLPDETRLQLMLLVKKIRPLHDDFMIELAKLQKEAEAAAHHEETGT